MSRSSSTSAATRTRSPSHRGSSASRTTSTRAILRDFRECGPQLWTRFSVRDPKEHLWYYSELLAVFKAKNTTWLVAELERVLQELEREVTAAGE